VVQRVVGMDVLPPGRSHSKEQEGKQACKHGA